VGPGLGFCLCFGISVELLAEIDLPLVILLSDPQQAADVWAAGARCLLLREAKAGQLLAALQAAGQGLVVFDPVLAGALLPDAPLNSASLVESLTPRELEVLQLLAEGLPNKTIARRLDISEHTVKFHVNAIMGKLNAHSRTEAVVRATQLGLILF
jgi:two-component system nitrate/nitrite response regulator NarL